jgi:triosephosphate isomerase
MNKYSKKIIIVNWKSLISNENEIKKLLLNINKNFKKYSKNSKKMSFYLSLPPLLISSAINIIKNKKEFSNIFIGAQNFDFNDKNFINNSTTLEQLISLKIKFTLLNYYPKYDKELNLDFSFEKKSNKEYKTTNILLERLNNVSKKFEDINTKNNNNELNREEINIEKKLIEKELLSLSEKISYSLKNNIITLPILHHNESIKFITLFIEKIMSQLHYNLFDKLIIVYKIEKNIELFDADNLKEKIILIRKTIANLYGLDNAKKVKIILSCEINGKYILNLLENTGFDGILIEDESLDEDFFGELLSKI